MKKSKLLIFLLAAVSSVSLMTAASFVGCTSNDNPPPSTEQPVTYTVTFNSNGGSSVSSQTVEEGEKVSKPTDPTRDGYTFGGWYTDSACTQAYDFNTEVSGNITLYAKWADANHEHVWDEYASDDDYHWNKCSECGTEDPDTMEMHDWGEWEVVTAPTHTEDGSEKRACSVCGHEQTRTINKHAVSTEWKTTETEHWHACTVEGCEEVSERGEHVASPTKVEVPPENGSGEGKLQTVCATCGYVLSEETANFINVNYELNISTNIGAAGTWADGFRSSIFELAEGSRTRTRSRTYESESYSHSLQLADDTTALVVNAPAAGTLTVIIQNGSSSAQMQSVDLTSPDGTVKSIEYPGKSADNPMYALTIELPEAGQYTLKRTSGTTDLYKASFNASVRDTPLQGIQVTNAGTVDYYEGQTLDTSALELNKVFSETLRTEPLDTTAAGVAIDTSAVDMTKSGTYAINIKYTEEGNEYKASYNVNVYALDSITIGKNAIKQGNNSYNTVYENVALKQLYFVGDSYSTDGMTITANTILGENKLDFILDSSLYTVSGFDSTTAGTKTITVSFTTNSVTKTATYEVYVMAQPDLSAATSVYTTVDPNLNTAHIGETTTVGTNTAYQFKTIQQALEFLENAGIQENALKYVILADGEYNEKVEVRVPNLRMYSKAYYDAMADGISEAEAAALVDKVTIEYDSLYGLTDESGFVHTTDSTATLAVRESAEGFTMGGITVSNYWNSEAVFDEAFGAGYGEHRALAALIQADKVTIDYTRFYGYQDTIEFFTGRQILTNSYISGTTDFIFGSNNTTYFKDCEICAILTASNDERQLEEDATATINGGYITAFKGNNGAEEGVIKYGAIFDGCDFTADEHVADGVTAIGRTWGADAAVIIMNSTLGAHISTGTGADRNDRYVTMNGNNPWGAQFLEYNNTGDGAIDSTWTWEGLETPVYPVLSGDTAAATAAQYADYSVIFAATNGGLTYDSAWDGETPAAPVVITVKNSSDETIATYIAANGEVLTNATLNALLPDDAIPDNYRNAGYALTATATEDDVIELGAVTENATYYLVVVERQAGESITYTATFASTGTTPTITSEDAPEGMFSQSECGVKNGFLSLDNSADTFTINLGTLTAGQTVSITYTGSSSSDKAEIGLKWTLTNLTADKPNFLYNGTEVSTGKWSYEQTTGTVVYTATADGVASIVLQRNAAGGTELEKIVVTINGGSGTGTGGTEEPGADQTVVATHEYDFSTCTGSETQTSLAEFFNNDGVISNEGTVGLANTDLRFTSGHLKVSSNAGKIVITLKSLKAGDTVNVTMNAKSGSSIKDETNTTTGYKTVTLTPSATNATVTSELKAGSWGDGATTANDAKDQEVSLTVTADGDVVITLNRGGGTVQLYNLTVEVLSDTPAQA